MNEPLVNGIKSAIVYLEKQKAAIATLRKSEKRQRDELSDKSGELTRLETLQKKRKLALDKALLKKGFIYRFFKTRRVRARANALLTTAESLSKCKLEQESHRLASKSYASILEAIDDKTKSITSLKDWLEGINASLKKIRNAAIKHCADVDDALTVTLFDDSDIEILYNNAGGNRLLPRAYKKLISLESTYNEIYKWRETDDSIFIERLSNVIGPYYEDVKELSLAEYIESKYSTVEEKNQLFKKVTRRFAAPFLPFNSAKLRDVKTLKLCVVAMKDGDKNPLKKHIKSALGEFGDHISCVQSPCSSELQFLFSLHGLPTFAIEKMDLYVSIQEELWDQGYDYYPTFLHYGKLEDMDPTTSHWKAQEVIVLGRLLTGLKMNKGYHWHLFGKHVAHGNKQLMDHFRIDRKDRKDVIDLFIDRLEKEGTSGVVESFRNVLEEEEDNMRTTDYAMAVDIISALEDKNNEQRIKQLIAMD